MRFGVRKVQSTATEQSPNKIGIGVRITPEPLPHHLACGSALGGSTLGSKLAPESEETGQSFLGEVLQRECLMHRLAGGHDPRAFAADTVSDRFFFSDAELSQIRDASARVTPLLPVTRPETTTDPLVEFAEEVFVTIGTKPK